MRWIGDPKDFEVLVSFDGIDMGPKPFCIIGFVAGLIGSS